jgi:uncharacterized protein (DUF2235 family)
MSGSVPATPITPTVNGTANCLPDTNEEPVLVGPTGAWQTKQRTWIPNPNDQEAHSHRTLVICFDGTGDRFDDDNSNIVQLVSLLKKDDASKQMVYYQTGIGTESEADARFSFYRTASQALDLMFATTLGHHVRQGYEFLCQNYQQNDVICIFGFSRGAYTARALAGMVQKVGVLPPWNTGMIPFAYQMYASSDPDTLRLAEGFKATFSVDVKIEFVGVWDTVASVGLYPRYLPFVSSNSSIRYFRHAVALDEHRVKFVPNYYRQSRDKDQANIDDWDLQRTNDGGLGQLVDNTATPSPTVVRSPEQLNERSSSKSGKSKGLPLIQEGFPDLTGETAKILKAEGKLLGDASETLTGEAQKALKAEARVLNNVPVVSGLPKKAHKQQSLQLMYENQLNKKSGQKTNSLEVWFAGSHCDVGGGSVPNHTRYSLARIPLRWMIRECFRCQTGIIFDANMLRDEVGMDVDIKNLRIMEAPERLRPDPRNERHRIPVEQATLEGFPFISNVPISAAALPLTIAKGVVSTLLSPITKLVTPKPQPKVPKTLEQIRAEREPFQGEAMEELLDAVSPMYDQLELAPHWWVLEFLPLQVKKELAVYMSADKALSNYTRIQNRGEGRKIFKHVVKRGMKVHRSVLTRLEALDEMGQAGTYRPRVKPNFVERKGKGKNKHEEHIQCRRMTNEEWVTQKTEKLPNAPWFHWV